MQFRHTFLRFLHFSERLDFSKLTDGLPLYGSAILDTSINSSLLVAAVGSNKAFIICSRTANKDLQILHIVEDPCTVCSK